LPLEPGTVVAKRYRVTRQLGKGGMGEVFAAENTRTGRMVALKVLRAEAKAKQTAIERFRREARAAGSIHSDFVTQVLDVEDDAEYGIVLVFELLEGESLVERLKRTGPLTFDELWPVVEAVWIGLGDAHNAGIVHRDLKPSNVFLEDRPGGRRRVKILDFGISKLPKKISTQSLTQVGQSLGTFSFMPPEQIGKAKTVDHRADIYACTTLIYQALSGKLPYHAKNVVAMMELKNKQDPRPLAEAMGVAVDGRIEAFIARGLARDPDQRFQTAPQALDEWRRLRPPGVVSLTELDASGTYPQALLDESPSSDEARTAVMRVRGGGSGPVSFEPLPQTLRDPAAGRGNHYGGAEAVAQTIPHPPQHQRTVTPPHGSPPATPPSGVPSLQYGASRSSDAHPPYSGQPYSGQPYSGQPYSGQPYSGQAMPQSRPSQGGYQLMPTLQSRYSAADSGVHAAPGSVQNPTTVDDPRGPAGYPMAYDAGPMTVPMRRQSPLRTLLVLVLSAIGLMLVGFAAVALVLHLTR
jgi:eukaryotic-like serine/threonine-protein kinase